MHRISSRPIARALRVLTLIAGVTGVSDAQGAPLPTPESVFGFPVGADRKLFKYDESIEYFRRLAATSPHVRLIDVGRTSFGRPWTAVVISSPENLARLDEYRRINTRLAHPEGLGDAEARRLAREGRAFVDISGGLHASEIAGSQHTPQLAYELLANAGEPTNKAILDNVIFFLWPSINPDGQDIVVENCRAREAGPNAPPMELYQKYIGHDNNRDSYMLNVVESRVIQRVWREWEPSIIYVHHQTAPYPTRIWLPPFADPIGLRAPALIGREVNTIGMAIAQELDSRGQPGATHQGTGYDAWYPGYIDYMPLYQNIAAFWTETQGGSCATPMRAVPSPDSLPAEFRDLRPTTMYVSPWAGGTWTLRNAVDYMVTASMATLSYAAKYKEELLYNRYQAGRNTIRKYQMSAPYAYFIPQAQHDPVAPVELLRRVAMLGVRIGQTDRDLTFEGTAYPRGTWVIPMDQEFAELVRELFEEQVYPTMGDDTPYDAAGWTLPYQMNVRVVEAKTPLGAEVRAAIRPVQGTPTDWRAAADAPLTINATAAGIVPAAGRIIGRGPQLILDPAQNNSFRLINRALADGGTLRFAPAAAGASGRYVVAGVAPAKLDRWAQELWVQGTRGAASATRGAVRVPTRIALYKAAPGNMDQGWTEWLFDTHDFKYTLITPADLRAGNLGARFDVIVFASQGLGGGGGRGGRGGGGGAGGGGGGGAPPPGTAQSPTDSATAAVDAFVRAGGTVVVWNQGTASFINALRLPVRNVLTGVSRNDYFTGGSIMEVTTDPTHPVMAGMPARADVFVSGSPVFTTLDGFKGSVLATYRRDASPLRSGFLRGEKLMQGYAAALDVKLDRGHVVLIAFQPQWRGQPTGTFRVVFNSAFFAGDVAAQAKGATGFWTPPTD
jgi:uncharacterized membrane protein YgcG